MLTSVNNKTTLQRH